MPAQKISSKKKRSLEFTDIIMEPKTASSQEIYIQRINDISNTDVEVSTSQAELEKSGENSSGKLTTTQWISVLILCFVNLINYMDRYTIAGILRDVTDYYQIGDDKAGLLQTAFILSYMLFAPIFGYLGDRYNRKIIMAFGVFLWSITTMAGSFMNTYSWFLFFRMLVGIGEASYSTIAPTIISDLFAKNLRSKMLAAFYFAIPVGSGLGYIIGSEAASVFKGWQYALRITPFAGFVAVLLILFVMKEPPRGQSEGRLHVETTSWKNDVKILLKNRSFVLSTAGFTCVAFVTGAFAWWAPHFIYSGLILQPGHDKANINSVSKVFGILTMCSGVLGVPLGMWLSQYLRSKYEHADPLICAFGLLISAPLLFLASWIASVNITICYVLIFIGEVFLNLNWSIVADILLYVVAPNRRSTAEAFQILVSHALGDAGSPYLIGVLSEFFKRTLSSSKSTNVTSLTTQYYGSDKLLPSSTASPEVVFRSLQYSLFTTSFVEVLGGVFFLLTAVHVVRDRALAERQLQGEDNPVANSDLYSDASDVETAKNSVPTI